MGAAPSLLSHSRAGPRVMPELPPQQLGQEVPSSPSPIVTASAASKAPFFRRNATNLSSRVLPRTEMPHYVPHVGTSLGHRWLNGCHHFRAVRRDPPLQHQPRTAGPGAVRSQAEPRELWQLLAELELLCSPANLQIYPTSRNSSKYAPFRRPSCPLGLALLKGPDLVAGSNAVTSRWSAALHPIKMDL